jgi:hypothetical protein
MQVEYMGGRTVSKNWRRPRVPACLKYVSNLACLQKKAHFASGVLGAVLLLLRKKLAAGVFLVSFLSMVVTTIYNFGLSNGLEAMGDPFALFFSALIFVFALLLFLYAKAMKNRGALV